MLTQTIDWLKNICGHFVLRSSRHNSEARGFDVLVTPIVLIIALSAIFLPRPTPAKAVATGGCPVFHCTIESSGIVGEAVIPDISAITKINSLGTLVYQGCSGNGSVIACLFSVDRTSGIGAGTLKVLDATTLEPVWGSAGTPGSFNLSPAAGAAGQVPVNFTDGTFGAGDSAQYVHYSAKGALLGKAILSGTGANFGMTPISATDGIVSQSDGTLTLINLTTWKTLSTLKLTAPGTSDPVRLVSPSSAGPSVLYAVSFDAKTGSGWLYSVGLNSARTGLVVKSSYRFSGSGGASPVVVTPTDSGLAYNVILLPTPGLIGEIAGQSYLAAIEDNPATGLELLWSIAVPQTLLLSPTFDVTSKSIFYTLPGSPNLYQANLQSGESLGVFNMQSIGDFNSQFQLSGHLNNNVVDGVATLLLGAIVTPPLSQTSTQYAIAFQPFVSPQRLLWSELLDTTTVPLSHNNASPNVYTAAWNYVPSTVPGTACVVSVAVQGDNLSTIIRLCDH